MASLPKTQYAKSGDLHLAEVRTHGVEALKGVPGEWRLFAVSSSP
jgi:hypothetical protein